ncbi:MAG: peptide chain release factor H [Oscillibacter sp.]|nr:peptide chain release factor H [Oscillibacter sp.]
MIYQISSGQGPAECELGVAKFLEYLSKHHQITVLETSRGYNEGTFRSAKFSTEADLSQYEGSVQWICRSLYRPTHKRKNWFLDFSSCQAARTEEFDREQVVFETFRSGGKGGQNVNKVESGVRAIYLPTGQAVECTEERSQYANKQKAIARLREITRQKNREEQATVKNSDWRCHTSLERGNAGAVFIGMEFKKK